MDDAVARASGAPVARVAEYIAEHFSERLSIGQLARLANVSESHLKTQFRRTTGMPVHRYIVRTRVQFAMCELTIGRLSLSEVANRAGFADQSHMTRWIKRIAGVPPGQLSARMASHVESTPKHLESRSLNTTESFDRIRVHVQGVRSDAAVEMHVVLPVIQVLSA